MRRKLFVYYLCYLIISTTIFLFIYLFDKYKRKLYITIDFKLFLKLLCFFFILSTISFFISYFINQTKLLTLYTTTIVIYILSFFLLGNFIEAAEEGLNVFLAFVGLGLGLIFCIVHFLITKFININ